MDAQGSRENLLAVGLGAPTGRRGRRGAALKTPTEHSRQTHRLVVTVSAMMFAVLLPGCSVVRERACNSGEHAVKSIEAPETGRACVRDGQPPPQGYEEYPPGQVPKYADQE